MVMNLLVILFIALMAYWWALQGFFSAFLHMVIVIVSGAIAFALMEPLAYRLLAMEGTMATLVAWGTGLLAPFGISLILLRTASDRLIGQNLNFPDIVNKIGGGLFGAVAAVITAGVILIGLMFMPLGNRIGQYEPYIISASGQITENEESGLFVPVDRWTAGFYTRLSAGAFTSGNPIARYVPDLARTAGAFRVHVDDNATIIAGPGTITIESMHIHDTPFEDVHESIRESFSQLANPGQKLVVLDTVWKSNPRITYDRDGNLRLPPSHVQLVVQNRDGEIVRHQASLLALAEGDPNSPTGWGARMAVPADSHTSMLRSSVDNQPITAMFLIRESETPLYLSVRNLRLYPPTSDLEPAATREQITQLVGFIPTDEQLAASNQQRQEPSRTGPRTGARSEFEAGVVERNAALPRAISRNDASGMNVADSEIISANREVARRDNVSQQLRIDKVREGQGRAIIRVEVHAANANSLFGHARAAAATIQAPLLEDNYPGDPHQAVGFVLLKPGGEQHIRIDFEDPIRSATQLPRHVDEGDQLYLYFDVPLRNQLQITRIRIGASSWDIEPPLALD